MWTENFQMFKLVLEKAEEPEIKLPTSSGLQKKQENSRKVSIFASLTMLKALTVWITTNWKILTEMGIPGFSSNHVCMWKLDQEGQAPENRCFWTVVLEKTLESPMDSKEIKAVNPKGNKSWIFIGRTDANAPILWPPDMKSLLVRKDPDAGEDWRQEVKGMTEDEMIGWHYRLNGHEFEQTLGDGEGQGSLAWDSPWCCKESDIIEQLNNSKKSPHVF